MSITIQTMRRCPRCEQVKVLEYDFFRNKNRKNGYGCYCKACNLVGKRGERHSSNRTVEDLRRARDYYAQNSALINAQRSAIKAVQHRQKREANPELPESMHKPNAKLNERKVRAIRAALAAGVPMTRLAHTYGVHEATILRIKRREIWDDV